MFYQVQLQALCLILKINQGDYDNEINKDELLL